MPSLLVALATWSLAQADVSPAPAQEVAAQPDVKEEKKAPNWPASPSARRFEINTGASLGLRPEAGTWGGTGTVGISFRVLPFLRPELVLGTGLYDGPFDLVTFLRVGVRGELPIEFPLRPYLWVAFAHNHETQMAHVAQHPVDAILGTSDHGVGHRTGVEFGLGASFDVIQFREAKVGLRVGLRATAALFAGTGTLGYGDLTTTLGTTF